MNIETIRPSRPKAVEDRRTDFNLIKKLISDLVIYNDLKKDIQNLDDLWDRQLDLLADLEDEARNLLEKAVTVSGNHQSVRVAVVGNFSAGKSTFINSLLQEDICPIGDKSTTSSVTTFSFAHNLAFYLGDNTGFKMEISRNDYEEMIQHGTNHTVRGTEHFFVEGPWNFVRDISLLDTPGFQRGADSFSTVPGGDDAVTEEVIIKEADVLFWLMDVNTGTITQDQKERIVRLKRETKNMVDIYFVLNRSDEKGATGRQKVIDDIQKEIGHLIKDVFLYSSISTKQKSPTLPDILKKIKESVNNQSSIQQEKWELKLSSSIGGRGGLNFFYHDNGKEILFSHKFKNGIYSGRISTRLEVQDMIKEIGTRKKELSLKHFDKEAQAYKKRIQNLIYFKTKIDKKLESLHSDFSDKEELFDKELDAISSDFIKNNIRTFNYFDIEKESQDIINAFIKLYSNSFEIFLKKVNKEFNFFLIIDETFEYLDLEHTFKTHLGAGYNIENSMYFTTEILVTHLESTFTEDFSNRCDLLETRFTDISHNLETLL